MTRKVPIVPTIIVVAAVLTMIGLGIWQLQRAAWKESLLAHYREALTMSSDVPFPVADPAAAEKVLYRHSRVNCRSTSGQWDSIAGRNAQGEAGYVHIAHCEIGDGKIAYVQAGWSQRPEPPVWQGGAEVGGFVAPYNKGVGARLIASPPLAGLEANAAPNPEDIPNNHMAYVFQWFFFAATAAVIYMLALRKRWKSSPERSGGSPQG
jgi:surfeit locus 1 family protein